MLSSNSAAIVTKNCCDKRDKKDGVAETKSSSHSGKGKKHNELEPLMRLAHVRG